MFRRSKHTQAKRACEIREAARRANALETGGLGPPAISLARTYFWDRDTISIDPLETVFERDGTGVRVRAWVHVPPDRISPDTRASIEIAARAFFNEPLLASIFFLRTSYGLPVRDIAALLDIPKRKARRLLMRAIAHLDQAN